MSQRAIGCECGLPGSRPGQTANAPADRLAVEDGAAGGILQETKPSRIGRTCDRRNRNRRLNSMTDIGPMLPAGGLAAGPLDEVLVLFAPAQLGAGTGTFATTNGDRIDLESADRRSHPLVSRGSGLGLSIT